MKTLKPLAYALFGMTTLAATLTSCQDYDLGYTAEQIQYESNFEKKYGPIAPDKSWDLSSYAYHSSPRTRANTNLSDLPLDSEGYYHVTDNTLAWLDANLQESRDNRSLGSNFLFESTGEPFAIIPIYQGQTGMKWSLFMKNGSETSSQIWQQSENMMKSDDGETWNVLGWTDNATFSKNKGGNEATCSTIGKKVKAKPILVNSNENDLIHFSLHIDFKKTLNNGNEWGDSWALTGTFQSSLNNMMLAMKECPTPSNLPAGYKVLIVGCEDANRSSSDWDMNDAVFMVVAKELPRIVEGRKITKKRYMCEDLGSTFDFDFNDIVVDVTQTEHFLIKIQDPEAQIDEDAVLDLDLHDAVLASPYIIANSSKPTEQIARLSHVCGTLPFQVTVGDTDFPLVKDPTNIEQTRKDLYDNNSIYYGMTRGGWEESDGWNPNETFKVTGWNPDQNNITIKVYTHGLGDGTNDNTGGDKIGFQGSNRDANGWYQTVTFPVKGYTPFIIAVDQSVPWMAELTSIPQAWANANADFTVTTGMGKQGSEAYYFQEGNSFNGDVVIWSGYEKTPKGTSFVYGASSSQYLALSEALGNTDKNYNALIITTEEATGSFEICDASGTVIVQGNQQIVGGKALVFLSADEVASLKSAGGFSIHNTSSKTMTLTSIQMTSATPCVVTLTAEGGSDQNKVIGSGTYALGSTIVIKAVAAQGNAFVSWSDDEEEMSAERTLTLEQENYNITATFQGSVTTTKITFKSDGEGGKIKLYETSTPTSSITIDAVVGKRYNPIPVPDNGYIFAGWLRYSNSFTMPTDGVLIESGMNGDFIATWDDAIGEGVYEVYYEESPEATYNIRIDKDHASQSKLKRAILNKKYRMVITLSSTTVANSLKIGEGTGAKIETISNNMVVHDFTEEELQKMYYTYDGGGYILVITPGDNKGFAISSITMEEIPE